MRRVAPPISCLLVLFAAAYSHPGYTQNKRKATTRAKPTPKTVENILDLLPDETPTPKPRPSDEDYGISTTAPRTPPTIKYLSQERETLRDLKGFLVVVEELDSMVEQEGLTAKQLRVDTELRLHRAGVQVLSETEWGRDIRRPLLYVNVNVKSGPEGLYIYTLSVEVGQRVYLLGGASAVTIAKTWAKEAVGSVGGNNLRQLRASVGDYVDVFLNDYLAVNPK